MLTSARAARRNSVAPFSGFRVGASLLTKSGAIVNGCNVENATLGLTVCAERVALWKALSEGHRGFRAVCVTTAASRPTPPCGACRQLLWEFCGDVPVYMINSRGKSKTMMMSELFPEAFSKKDL